MNVHHLELFYHVATHGGISEAVRNMPYGIQQPAVSGQILQLEDFLGVTLFQRRPFALTPEGERLFEHIKPFFGSLDQLTRELQGDAANHVRVGASEIVLRDHLPEIMDRVRQVHPRMKFALCEGHATDLMRWLEKQEIDLAVSVLGGTKCPGLQFRPLIELPLMLLVQKESRIRSADELWRMDRIEETLICLPSSEAMCKQFQQELGRRGVDWFPGIEVSSIGLIQTYVAKGFGIGLMVNVPKTKLPAQLRGISLADFPPLVMGVFWRGKSSALAKTLFDELEKRARRLSAA